MLPCCRLCLPEGFINPLGGWWWWDVQLCGHPWGRGLSMCPAGWHLSLTHGADDMLRGHMAECQLHGLKAVGEVAASHGGQACAHITFQLFISAGLLTGWELLANLTSVLSPLSSFMKWG